MRRHRSCGVGLLASLVLVSATGSSADDAPGMDEISLARELVPVEDETLATSRGGAVMPGGLEIEVTAILRVIADGQDLITTSGTLAAAHALAGTQSVLHSDMPGAGSPVLESPILVNYLDGVELQQFREINFHIRNLPTPMSVGPRIPALIMGARMNPY